MTSPHAAWRSHPFAPGHSYVAKVLFTGWPSHEFIAGDHYLFESAVYSHYDSSTVFTFAESATGKPVQWWWHDDEPDMQCKERFASADMND
jgi:hypothetical protein